MTPVHITDLGVHVPRRRMSIDEIVRSGRYERERAAADGFTAIAVEDDLDQAGMAAAAARKIIREEDAAPGAVNTVYLASIHRSGHKLLWPAVSRLHRDLALPRTVRTVGISQGCNGAISALSLAAEMIAHGVKGDQIVVGSDRFGGSSFDRVNSDLGTLYGDAAAAMRLSSTPGWARILHCAIESEPDLEEMYRDEHVSDEGPGDHEIKLAKRAYLDRVGKDHFFALFTGALRRLRDALITGSVLAERPADWIVYPNVGAGLSAHLYDEVLGPLARRNVWDHGRAIGHTGTVDQFLGLAHLRDSGALAPGARVLLVGAGNGLSLTAALIETNSPASVARTV